MHVITYFITVVDRMSLRVSAQGSKVGRSKVQPLPTANDARYSTNDVNRVISQRHGCALHNSRYTATQGAIR